MADRIQIRRDTAANWASVNPVLAQGEMGLETDTERMKLGDGTTVYNSLNYFVTSQTNVGITGGTINGTVIGGSTPAAGSFTTGAFSGEIAANGGIALGDNDKATFGASDDLELYHDGNNSYINDTGTGALLIRGSNVSLGKYTGETMVNAFADGRVDVYYDNAIKLTTTTSGIDVTGTVTADGLTVSDATGTVGLFNSTGVASTLAINNTHTNAWGSNIAFRTGGTDAGYFGSIGSLLGNTDQDLVSYSTAGNGFRIYTNGNNERMRINSSGNLLVGTTTTRGIGATIYNPNGVGRIDLNKSDSGAATAMGFYYVGGLVGSISYSDTATAYNTSSDYRLKEDAVPMTGATERVKALRPINFAWKADGSRTDGFFAHEAQEVVPECATGSKDAMRDEEYEVTPAVEEVRDEDGNVTTEAVAAVMGTRSVPDYQGIDQSKLVPLLTATIQELIARIEALEGAK
jgi:hypothetical protein